VSVGAVFQTAGDPWVHTVIAKNADRHAEQFESDAYDEVLTVPFADRLAVISQFYPDWIELIRNTFGLRDRQATRYQGRARVEWSRDAAASAVGTQMLAPRPAIVVTAVIPKSAGAEAVSRQTRWRWMNAGRSRVGHA